eukprot:SAG31_NODE_4774_length_2965_cov_10.544313_2_plen_74_part_00
MQQASPAEAFEQEIKNYKKAEAATAEAAMDGATTPAQVGGAGPQCQCSCKIQSSNQNFRHTKSALQIAVASHH